MKPVMPRRLSLSNVRRVKVAIDVVVAEQPHMSVNTSPNSEGFASTVNPAAIANSAIPPTNVKSNPGLRSNPAAFWSADCTCHTGLTQ